MRIMWVESGELEHMPFILIIHIFCSIEYILYVVNYKL